MHVWVGETLCLHQRVADMLAGAVLGAVATLGLIVSVSLLGTAAVLRRELGMSVLDVIRYWRG